eukprot:superscaffoldBa00008193_g23154
MTEVTTIAALYLLWKSKIQRKPKRHRVWIHDIIQRRTQLGEFHRLLQDLCLDDGRFQRYFRLTRAQSDDLLARIGARILWLDTNYRRSVSAAPVHLSPIVPDVVTATWDCIVEEFMAVPTTEEWRSIAERFEERWNFPLCCGALDGKHVVLKAPANSGSQNFNYKGTFSLVLLTILLSAIDVGGYGRTSDSGILANSAFGQTLRSGTPLLPADLPLSGADQPRTPATRLCC